MREINFFRTDLLDESQEMVKHQTDDERRKLREQGVAVSETRHGKMIMTKVSVNEQGEKNIGKKKGEYTTFTMPNLYADDIDGLSEVSEHLITEIERMVTLTQADQLEKVLCIGLGNHSITPDAIGPRTMEYLSEEVYQFYAEEDSGLYVFAPGVTIQTGLETTSFVKALVEEIKPTVLIVVDALAARNSSRLCRTIQLTNTGIHPGAGVGNNRTEISHSTIGIPVFAIGIPTVVDGPVFMADAIDKLFSFIGGEIEEQALPSSKLTTPSFIKRELKPYDPTKLSSIFGEWATWTHDERMQLFEEVFQNLEHSSFVAPKEIDAWVESYAIVLSQMITTWLLKRK